MWYCCVRDQQQSPRSVLVKRCSQNMQQICMKTCMLQCDFNKVACNFIKITLQHGRSSVNSLHIFRIPFDSNSSQGILHSYLVPIKMSQIQNIVKEDEQAKSLKELNITMHIQCLVLYIHGIACKNQSLSSIHEVSCSSRGGLWDFSE